MRVLALSPSPQVEFRRLGALSSKLVLPVLVMPVAIQAVQVVQARQAAMVLLGMVLQEVLGPQHLVLALQVQVQHLLQVALRAMQPMQDSPQAQAQAVRAQAAC